MHRRRFLELAGLGLALAALPGIATAEPAFNLQSLIQKEMRKLDPWAAYLCQDNYTKEAPAKFCSLAIESGSQDNALQEFGLKRYHVASYNPETNTLLLPEPTTLEQALTVVSFLPHELTHAMTDKDGILESRRFKGPSWKKIENYCSARMKDPEFVAMRQKVTRELEVDTIDENLRNGLTHNVETYNQAYASYKEAINLRERIGIVVEPRLDPEKRKMLDATQEILLASLRDQGTKLHNLRASYLNWSATRKYDKATSQKGKEYLSLLAYKDLATLKETASLYEDTIHRAYSPIIRRDYEDLMSIIAKKKESTSALESSQYLLTEISLEKYHKLCLTSAVLCKAPQDSLMNDSTFLFRSLHHQQYLQKVEEAFSPPEVFARMVDSLYNLSFHPFDMQRFALSSQDLKFLGSFQYKKKSMFSKGLERYTIARKLQDKGAASQDVKHMLEYATSHDFGNVHYDWPENNFTLQGSIPII